MKTTATSTPTNDPHVTLELLDQAAPKPSGKNRSRAEQRHHRDRVKQNRTNKIRESEPGVDLDKFNQRWLNGLDDHNLGCSCRGCRADSQANKYSTRDRRHDNEYPDDTGDYYHGTDY